MLLKYEGKDARQVVGGDGTFPAPLLLTSNIPYVRKVLDASVNVTTDGEGYVCLTDLPKGADFFRYQERVNHDLCEVRSHTIIEDYIREHGMDYRFETAPNPIEALRDRTHDNTEIGRCPSAVDGHCTMNISR
jgi:hypothetical protein